MDVPKQSQWLEVLPRDVADERREKGNGTASRSFRISFSFGLILCSCILLPGARSRCEKKPVIFNFGDSNSDTGGFSAESGVVFKLPFGRAFFHDQNGRISDGRLIIDFFCESLNISYLSPYLESLGSNFTNGANFAVAGATALRKFNPFSLDVQVLQFLRFRERSLLLIAKGYSNLVNEEEFENALYIIDIGQNDLFVEFIDLSYEQVIQNISTSIAVIESAIRDIHKTGGKNFWIHNTGPLGCLPQKLATTTAATTDYDPVGCLVPLNNAAREFNRQLRALCEKLQCEMEGTTVVYIDIYSVKYELVSNSAKYGFENPLMVCCGHGGPPYNYDPSTRCGNSSVVACGLGPRYVSWDGIHHTEAANAFYATSILSSKFSTPRDNLNFFCNV